MYEKIGNFENGKAKGECSKEYVREDLKKYNGFGTFKNDIFYSNNERMSQIGAKSFKAEME